MNGAELANTSSPVAPGQVIGGKYRVERVLGIGGMGVVVAAYHLQLQTHVAIKFLLPHVARERESLERFLREARAAIQIRSEHVARVFDVDTLEDGTPYMVMEYLQGQDLCARVEQSGAIPVDQAVTYLLQVCEALAEAHAIGIVHRDLKPANLYLTERRNGTPSIKILDFGISKLSSSSGAASMTRVNSVMGSPYYMSPEQFGSAKNADARSDIWSLGIVLYELVIGVPPFHEDSLPALCRQVISEAHPPVRQLRPELPEALDRIVSGCLAKDPAQRYQTVEDLERDLRRLAKLWTSAPAPSLTPPVGPAIPQMAQSAAQISSPTFTGLASTTAGTRKRAILPLLLTAGGLTLAVASFFAVRAIIVASTEPSGSSATLSSASQPAAELPIPTPRPLSPEPTRSQSPGPATSTAPSAPEASAQPSASASSPAPDPALPARKPPASSLSTSASQVSAASAPAPTSTTAKTSEPATKPATTPRKPAVKRPSLEELTSERR